MRRSRLSSSLGLSAILLAVVTAGLAPSGAVASSAFTSSLDDVVVRVTPGTGIDDGTLVRAVAHGLPASTTFDVVLCDSLGAGGYDYGCAPLTTVTSDPNGRALTRVRLPAYQLHDDVFEGHPVYCRADLCHLFFAVTDPDGVQTGASSPALEFVGSPATVAASPSTDLPSSKTVHVTGTAYGAEGRTVLVGEHGCVHRPTGGSECVGSLTYRAAVVDATGHFQRSYRVRRQLPFGNGGHYDCAKQLFYTCSMTAVVLDEHGQPDLSFGNSDPRADPAAVLEFVE